jgi:hypothetical protein
MPSNLGLHFKIPQALVLGIYRDYLIPTLFITDLLFILLICVNFRVFKKIFKSFKRVILLFLPLFFVLFAQQKIVAFFKAIKIIEMICLYFYLRQAEIDKKQVVKGFFFSAVFQALLAISQFFNQGSVLSYLPFGEQPFSINSSAVKKLMLPSGRLVVAPLGTLPHSNLLGAYLFFALFLFLPLIKKWWHYLFAVIIQFAIFLTFSLPVILLSIAGWLYFIFKKGFRFLSFFTTLLFLGLAGFYWPYFSITAKESLFKRLPLIKSSLLMIKNNLVFGVGLNNFLVQLHQFLAPNQFNFYQPVHNFFLLLFAETGSCGLLVFISYLFLFLKKNLAQLFKKQPLSAFCLFSWVVLAMVDHYFYTLQQGLLVTVLLFSLVSGAEKS